MTQREYIIRNVKEQWKAHYRINYLFDRLLKQTSILSDSELFEPRHDACMLKNGTLSQYNGKTIRLISNSPRKIEESRSELSKLLNNVPLIEI